MSATLFNTEVHCGVVAVYIPLNAKAREAFSELHDNICSLQNKHPEAFVVIAGDFYNVNLTDTTPGFYQHVTIVTRGDNTPGVQNRCRAIQSCIVLLYYKGQSCICCKDTG